MSYHPSPPAGGGAGGGFTQPCELKYFNHLHPLTHKLQDISALKTVKKVGGNLFLQSLDQLTDQNLATFAALNTVAARWIL